jgi:L-idonate 5-dehydrogenase
MSVFWRRTMWCYGHTMAVARWKHSGPGESLIVTASRRILRGPLLAPVAQAMKAVVIHQALDLRLEEREAASPGPGQIVVAIKRGGICGSDLHYYKHGGFGSIRLKEPMVLGHEVAGKIVSVGAGVANLRPGDVVAVNPSRPCGLCEYCQKGRQNHCLDMLFYGSAMRMPHVQGAFQQLLMAQASQAHVIASDVSIEEAAFAEPFAVTLHAIARAGSLVGKRVLITGCGPIGTLAIVSARAHGAQEIVATDVSDFTLAVARKIGADKAINVTVNDEAMTAFKASKGFFDVMIEASGNEAALHLGLEVLRPRSVLIQLGLGGNINVPQNTIVAKEIEIRGSFRFQEEFGLAVDMINRKRVDLMPLLTAVIPLADAKRAFDLAADRRQSMKVQIAF